MTSDELKDLIDSIKVEANYDHKAGNTTTTYKLPEEALNEEVIEALEANFEHYKSCTVTGNTLTLEHPDVDD
ncbi:hypothetical protein J7J47_07705 [Halomonas sp. ISL-60]|uniref:hypothetical protein n=1 Tax=Halomonas sp. ISL-56 TaxID=2819149 RepID=UPI001BE81CF2|nr:hypothetical protein [Halomonas sp. ISL-56]MBT2772117.1 hypothetical protein [Halomonas sp. ISL-60]MBT2800812.1 hypothetical protein [Halomonas sp. ISL-56]